MKTHIHNNKITAWSPIKSVDNTKVVHHSGGTAAVLFWKFTLFREAFNSFLITYNLKVFMCKQAIRLPRWDCNILGFYMKISTYFNAKTHCFKFDSTIEVYLEHFVQDQLFILDVYKENKKNAGQLFHFNLVTCIILRLLFTFWK